MSLCENWSDTLLPPPENPAAGSVIRENINQTKQQCQETVDYGGHPLTGTHHGFEPVDLPLHRVNLQFIYSQLLFGCGEGVRGRLSRDGHHGEL